MRDYKRVKYKSPLLVSIFTPNSFFITRVFNALIANIDSLANSAAK